jgi:hypothetical protein
VGKAGDAAQHHLADRHRHRRGVRLVQAVLTGQQPDEFPQKNALPSVRAHSLSPMRLLTSRPAIAHTKA